MNAYGRKIQELKKELNKERKTNAFLRQQIAEMQIRQEANKENLKYLVGENYGN